jgi:hypothetical protein
MIDWVQIEPTEIPGGQMIITVSDGAVRYYATVSRRRTVLGIGREFAHGFDHGESTDEVTATIERRVQRVGWEFLGRIKFGPNNKVRRVD